MGPHSLFSWIHLSDIHIGHGDATHVEDQKLVLSALRSDVEQLVSSGSQQPDAIFVTGDIAFSGAIRTNDEYTRARKWLTDIAKAAKLGPEAIFVVPGNHDVQRPVDKPLKAQAVLRQLRGGEIPLDEALKDSSILADLRARQANYLAFAEGLAPALRADAEVKGAQLYWRHTLKGRGGLRVRLVGLNTALLAADEALFGSDQGRLHLGTRQLAAVFTEPDATADEAVVVLSHHPLRQNWLKDEVEAARWIRKQAHLHLSGHVHEAASERARGGGGTDFVSISAGAAHGEKTPRGYPARHGYSFGALVSLDGALKIHVWPRMWSDQNKDFRIDVDNVPQDAKYAEHNMPRVRLLKGEAPGSCPQPPGIGAGATPPPAPRQQPKISSARLPPGAEQFVGRKGELSALDHAWSDDGTHVLTIVAWGGTGKSTLVAEWIARMLWAGWRGAAKVFGWSFYSQGVREEGAASADLFVNQALEFFGDKEPTKGSIWDRGERLAVLVRKQRTLLVLDGLEPLQEPESSGGRLRDQALTALLRSLAADMNGLCIVTTRQPVRELAEFAGKTVGRMDLDQLSEPDGAELLRLCGVEGSEEELREVVHAVSGHALTVTLLGNYIADALDADIRRWREVPLGTAKTSPGEHARHVMEAYDQWFGPGPERAILRIIGLFDRPASVGCVEALRQEPVIPGVTDALSQQTPTEAQWRLAVNRLRKTGLLARAGKTGDGSLNAHPLVRESFGAMLKQDHPEGFRAAHRRLYEHLRDTTPTLPETLEGLQPLYQAIWHGCRAGLHQEALSDIFHARIRRGNEHYSLHLLGAFGADLAALAEFFDGDWTQPVSALSKEDQQWVMSDAAFALKTLGRTRDAVAPMKAALSLKVSASDWENAAICASNFSDLCASRGALREALLLAEKAEDFANRSGDTGQRITRRTSYAYILYLLGRRSEARSVFEESEGMQAEFQPDFPLLYGLRGRKFCELLLDLGEAQEVKRRASRTLGWLNIRQWRHDAARDHLSLGCALWRLEEWEESRTHFTQALSGLRSSGQQDYLSAALVLQGAFHCDVGERDAARHVLDEALGIAKRAEYKLVECDAHLGLAKLALLGNDPAAARTMFEAASVLVGECEYRRRDCQLALVESRLALMEGNRHAARAAYERARKVADVEKLGAFDKELAELEAAVA